jgi:hypothetical protein
MLCRQGKARQGKARQGKARQGGKSTEFYKKLGAKVMKKELNYLVSKRWEKVGRQELRSTPCKQEIDPWSH